MVLGDEHAMLKVAMRSLYLRSGGSVLVLPLAVFPGGGSTVATNACPAGCPRARLAAERTACAPCARE